MSKNTLFLFSDHGQGKILTSTSQGKSNYLTSLSGIYLENGHDGTGLAHQVQRTWAGDMGAISGPY